MTEFGFEVEDLHSADLSRDGRRLAFTDGSKVFIRNLDDRRPRAVFEKPNIQDLFWSPDGQELAIDVDEQLWRVNVDTGESELICDLPDLPRVPRAFILAGAWRPDGTRVTALVFTRSPVDRSTTVREWESESAEPGESWSAIWR